MDVETESGDLASWERYLNTRAKNAHRLMIWCGIIIYPAFGVLDFVSVQNWKLFLAIRLVGALATRPIQGHQAVIYTWLLIICSSGHNLVLAGLDRYASNGNTTVGFWFFRNPVSVNSNGTFSGIHSDGDVLLVVDFSVGGVSSAVGVYRGANWHERETYEMFGVVFEGHPDLRPLPLPDGFEGHPLRKDFVLAARVAKVWPGAKEPGESGHGAPSRRKMAPPGVPADWGKDA